MDFDLELLGEIAEHAPTAGGDFNFTNYGRVWMDNVQKTHWDDNSKSYVREEYKGGKLKKKDNGDPYDEYVEFQLHMDMSEINPAITFEKTWFIAVKKSSKRNKTDWDEYIEDPIVKLFKSLGAFFKAMATKKQYVAIEDFATGKMRTSKKDGKDYPVTVPVFRKVYKSKAECLAERKAKQDKDMEFPVESNGKVPDSIVKQVQGLLQSVGEEQALTMLETKPFGEYEPAELIEAAKTE